MRFNFKAFSVAIVVATSAIQGAEAERHRHHRHHHQEKAHEGKLRAHPLSNQNKSSLGNLQSAFCLLREDQVETLDGGHKVVWKCKVTGSDAFKAGAPAGVNHATVTIEGMEHVLHENHGIESSKTTLLADGAILEDYKLKISASNALTFGTNGSRRRLDTTNAIGTHNVLVVRVKTTDKEPTASVSTLSDKVFGTSGDKINLKSIMEGCSHGKMSVQPATGSGVTNGAMEISINMAAVGSNSDALKDAAESFLESHFQTSDLSTLFRHVLFVVPKGSSSEGDPDWGAYAGVFDWYSMYNDVWFQPTGQAHEIGHNLGLDHSNENGEEYDDNSGVMGTSFTTDEGKEAKECFNPAKSWQLKWYADKNSEINPDNGEVQAKLVGVANYNRASGSDKVILKLPGPSIKDYFIGFNHADGWNEGTTEAWNQVTVVMQQMPDDPDFNDHSMLMSDLVAKLSSGQKYTTQTGVEIRVLEIDKTASTGFARVQICKTGSCSAAPTQAPCVNDPDFGQLCYSYGTEGDMQPITCELMQVWSNLCADYGDYTGSKGLTGNQACCACNGGDDGKTCQDDASFDLQGSSCTDFGHDADWCGEYGDWPDSNGKKANDVCCACNPALWTGGGPTPPAPTPPAPTPTAPTPPAPTPTAPTPTPCLDDADWKEQEGGTCADWTQNPDWCEEADEWYDESGKTAAQACCVCKTPTCNTPDDADWMDQGGDTCETWTQNPDWCEVADEWPDESGKTAAQACCVCKS